MVELFPFVVFMAAVFCRHGVVVEMAEGGFRGERMWRWLFREREGEGGVRRGLM